MIMFEAIFAYMVLCFAALFFVGMLISAPAGLSLKTTLAIWLIVCVAIGAFFFPYALDEKNNYGECQDTVMEISNLVAMKDTTRGEGAFFLFAGSYQEQDYYVYYYALPDGGMRLGKIDVDFAIIYEDRSDGTGMLERIDPMECDGYNNCRRCVQGSFWSTYHFHIPPGSIQRGFTMDLEK